MKTRRKKIDFDDLVNTLTNLIKKQALDQKELSFFPVDVRIAVKNNLKNK